MVPAGPVVGLGAAAEDDPDGEATATSAVAAGGGEVAALTSWASIAFIDATSFFMCSTSGSGTVVRRLSGVESG